METTMRSIRSLLSTKDDSKPDVIDVRQVAQRVLIEYVLNMAVTCLAHGDVEPLYEQYLADPRLSDEDRNELARAYLLLQMSSAGAPDTS